MGSGRELFTPGMSITGSIKGFLLVVTPTTNHHRSVAVEEVMPERVGRTDGNENDDSAMGFGKERVESAGYGKADGFSGSLGACSFLTASESGSSKPDGCVDRAAEKEGGAGDLLLERACGLDCFKIVSTVGLGDGLRWHVRLVAASAVPMLALLALRLR